MKFQIDTKLFASSRLLGTYGPIGRCAELSGTSHKLLLAVWDAFVKALDQFWLARSHASPFTKVDLVLYIAPS